MHTAQNQIDIETVEQIQPKTKPEDTLYKEMPKIETLYFNQLIRLFKNNGATLEEVITQLQRLKAKTLDLKKYVDPNSLGI